MSNYSDLAIGAGEVNVADIENLPTSTLIGRLTAGTGAPEQVTLGAGFTKSGTTLNAQAPAAAYAMNYMLYGGL